MQIKLYGNGHSCNSPVQEIIDKYWKDETAPFSFEMSIVAKNSGILFV